MQEAAGQKQALGIINEEIGRRAGRMLGVAAIDESRVSCLTGDTSTFDLVNAISHVLGIPPCVFVAESLPEAIRMAGLRAKFAAGQTEQENDTTEALITSAKRRIRNVRTAAKSIPKSHTAAIRSPHGTAAQGNGGGTGPRRR